MVKRKNKKALVAKKQFSSTAAIVLVVVLLGITLIYKVYSFAAGPGATSTLEVPLRYLEEFASLQAKAEEGCRMQNSAAPDSQVNLLQLKTAYAQEKANVDAWMVRDGYNKFLAPDFETMMAKNCPQLKNPA